MEHTGFELAHGGMIGRDHRQVYRNYQDGAHVIRAPTCTVAVVTDGCGSSPHSEIGAQIGVRLLCEGIVREVAYRGSSDINWPRVQQDVLAGLNVLGLQIGGSFRQTVEDYFLFTLVGVLLGYGTATFFALGDGVVVVNGEVSTLGPFPDNRPPYAGYGLIGGNVQDIEPSLSIQTVKSLNLDDLEHFLVGCDGVSDLIHAEERCLPGLEPQVVGSLSQFWEDDRYFSGNPDLVSRRLRLVGRDWPKKDSHPGLLPDDTTLVVGRRRPIPQPEEG